MRCKFWCDSVVQHPDYDPPVATIVMRAVYGGSPENDAFFAATPSGTLELGVVRPESAASLVIGAEYYLDITPVASSDRLTADDVQHEG